MVIRIGHTSGIRELPHALDIASFIVAFCSVVGAIVISWALHAARLRARAEAEARESYRRGRGDGAQDALNPAIERSHKHPRQAPLDPDTAAAVRRIQHRLVGSQ